MIPADQLATATGSTFMRAQNWAQSLEDATIWYDIDTPTRLAAFLAQIGVESGHLEYVREIWGPTSAQIGYEGRADLGNTEPGDGYRFPAAGSSRSPAAPTTPRVATVWPRRWPMFRTSSRNRNCWRRRAGPRCPRGGTGRGTGATSWPTPVSSNRSREGSTGA